MILLGSGFTATRGTQPPDVPVPWFCASAIGTTRRPATATSISVLRNFIGTPPHTIRVTGTTRTAPTGTILSLLPALMACDCSSLGPRLARNLERHQQPDISRDSLERRMRLLTRQRWPSVRTNATISQIS